MTFILKKLREKLQFCQKAKSSKYFLQELKTVSDFLMVDLPNPCENLQLMFSGTYRLVFCSIIWIEKCDYRTIKITINAYARLKI